jgi:succinylglutamate desuccinylase
MKKVLFVVASHGDESIGLRAIEKLSKKTGKKINYLIGNPEALKNNVRFVNSDLNRVYPGKLKGDVEEKTAYNNLKLIKKNKCDYVIDLHGTISKTGIFIIITKLSIENLLLALMLDIKKIVIWPKSKETKGSLSTFVRCGIEIESGPKNGKKVIENLDKILNKFLNNIDNKDNLKNKIKGKEFYIITGKIKNKKNMPEVRDFRKTGNFYSLFVGQYEGISCYKMKKTNYSNILKLANKNI